MNKNDFKYAELTIYTASSGRQTVRLSMMQVDLIKRVLGMEAASYGSCVCYSDETLKKLLEYKGNPLRLVPTSEEQ